jgi:NADPH-dependent glutamate synthase beta subunit-like oxidoreductase
MSDGFDAVFLAMGAHESWAPGSRERGIGRDLPSIEFLKEYNKRGNDLGVGHVG